jgi:hypothetical protein
VPAFGTVGSAMGTVIASGLVGAYALVRLWGGGWVVRFPRGAALRPDWSVIRALFRFGCPAGVQGIAMNVGGVLMLGFIGSLAQSAGGAGGVRGVVRAALLARHLDVGRAHGRCRHGRRPEPRRGPAGAGGARRGHGGADRPGRRGGHRRALLLTPRALLAAFGMNEPAVVDLGAQLLRVLSVSGLFVTVALTYTGGLQGTGDTRSPALHLDRLAGGAAARRLLCRTAGRGAPPDDGVAGDPRRARGAVRAERVALPQGRWRAIAVGVPGQPG